MCLLLGPSCLVRQRNTREGTRRLDAYLELELLGPQVLLAKIDLRIRPPRRAVGRDEWRHAGQIP